MADRVCNCGAEDQGYQIDTRRDKPVHAELLRDRFARMHDEDEKFNARGML